MLSFVFLVVSMHPFVELIWRHFFRHCPAGTEVVILSNESVLPKWGVPTTHAKFVYPEYNLRFTRDMVDLMNAGAMASGPKSTVVFVSDSSVPLKSCASWFQILTTGSLLRCKPDLGASRGRSGWDCPGWCGSAHTPKLETKRGRAICVPFCYTGLPMKRWCKHSSTACSPEETSTRTPFFGAHRA